MLSLKQKQGQVGLVTGLIFGIAALVLGVIVSFVLVYTLGTSGLFDEVRTTITVSDETGFINNTGYTLTNYSTTDAVLTSFSITSAVNATDGTAIGAGNYTLSSGVVTNATSANYPSANFTYTYSLKSTQEVSTENLRYNMTSGVDNVSSKIPTVLLIAAVVLILTVLGLLVLVWQKMRMGGATSI